jgi:hypothetical protein
MFDQQMTVSNYISCLLQFLQLVLDVEQTVQQWHHSGYVGLLDLMRMRKAVSRKQTLKHFPQ